MRLFGLVGYPLSHSFSPGYFTKKFREAKIDAEYRLFPLEDIQHFPALIEGYPQLSGLNVTIPYKEMVIPYLDTLDNTAMAIGAVNCIRTNNGRLEGFNTDAAGFFQSISPLLQGHHTRALILGTGGAAKAIEYILCSHGIECLLVSRFPGNKNVIYNDIDRQTIENHSLIINATPLGMFPDTQHKPPIPYEFITGRHLLYDVVYNPAETIFLKLGKERGAVVKNGYDMLVNQAEASWNIWNARQ